MTGRIVLSADAQDFYGFSVKINSTIGEQGEMKIKAYLYDAGGGNKEIEFSEGICQRLSEKQMLWVSVSERGKTAVEKVVEILDFKNVPVDEISDDIERPKLDKYENFYRLFINSVKIGEKDRLKRVPIDFLAAKNLVVTISGRRG